MAMILGVLMIVEAIGLFFIGSRYLGLHGDIQVLNTFGFEIMIYFRDILAFRRAGKTPLLEFAAELDAAGCPPS